MISRAVRFTAAITLTAGTLLAIAAPHASAVTADTDDNISPASTAVTSNLKAGTKFVSTGAINGIPITVTCTTLTFTGKTPATGLGPVPVNPPTISGCTDSLGGTDTVVTNKTNGSWKLKFVDASSDETAEKSGDKLVLTIPKAGAVFSSNAISVCKVIVAPTGPATEPAVYDDAGTATTSNAPLPVAGQNCTASSPAHVSSTLTVSPAIKDVS